MSKKTYKNVTIQDFDVKLDQNYILIHFKTKIIY